MKFATMFLALLILVCFARTDAAQAQCHINTGVKLSVYKPAAAVTYSAGLAAPCNCPQPAVNPTPVVPNTFGVPFGVQSYGSTAFAAPLYSSALAAPVYSAGLGINVHHHVGFNRFGVSFNRFGFVRPLGKKIILKVHH